MSNAEKTRSSKWKWISLGLALLIIWGISINLVISKITKNCHEDDPAVLPSVVQALLPNDLTITNKEYNDCSESSGNGYEVVFESKRNVTDIKAEILARAKSMGWRLSSGNCLTLPYSDKFLYALPSDEEGEWRLMVAVGDSHIEPDGCLGPAGVVEE